MKRITASEVRRNWFRVLDEVLAGEVIVVERKGRRVVLRAEEEEPGALRGEPMDYSDVLAAPEVDRADSWGWEWSEQEGVTPVEANADGEGACDSPTAPS